MSEFIRVASIGDIPSGEGRVIEVAGRSVALFNIGGEFYAIDNTCGHRGGPLGDGFCNAANLPIQCPWHGWVYNVSTGVCTSNPKERVETFEVMVEGNDVKVSFG
jgi:nitrite reductase/ring-hydroxylating ferredoxin subunit